MNKRGFTLTELLVTIGILAIMSLIVGVNLTSILRSTKKNDKEFEKKQIEKAACVYVDSENLCPDKNCDNNVTIQVLIDNGLLDKDVYKNYNKTKKITISRSNNKKTCTY